jgi:hypothetical protein
MELVQHLCPSADFGIWSSEALDSTAGELANFKPFAWFCTSGRLL